MEPLAEGVCGVAGVPEAGTAGAGLATGLPLAGCGVGLPGNGVPVNCPNEGMGPCPSRSIPDSIRAENKVFAPGITPANSLRRGCMMVS